MYELGDMTLDPWISIDNANYAQKNGAQVTLNSGASDYKMTAMYQKVGTCTNCNNVMIPCKQYTSLNMVEDTYCNPWGNNNVALAGTNGQQFSPLLWDDKMGMLMTNQIQYHNFDMGRTLNFTTSQTQPTVGGGDFAGFNLFTYNFVNFTTDAGDPFAGMTNTTYFMGVNSFVTLANYTGVSGDYYVQQSMPTWLNDTAPMMEGSAWYTLEQMSGRPV